MRAILQRVRRAAVRVGDETVGEIERGLLVLVAAERDDTRAEIVALADKLVHLRTFEADGKMTLDLAAVSGSLLVVSQFTLAASLRRGRRPSFDSAAPPDVAEPLIEELVAELRRLGAPVETGRFRAEMQVELVNDGPVTYVLDVRDGRVV
ncbi:MAG: D-aminoacyl-tRNA deacylase [Acidobacteriota bacterium]